MILQVLIQSTENQKNHNQTKMPSDMNDIIAVGFNPRNQKPQQNQNAVRHERHCSHGFQPTDNEMSTGPKYRRYGRHKRRKFLIQK